jgi:hypothetical protein
MVIGVVDAVFLMQPELDLHQHAGFLLHGVAAGENDLETFAVHLADRRFSHKLNRSSEAPFCRCGDSIAQARR